MTFTFSDVHWEKTTMTEIKTKVIVSRVEIEFTILASRLREEGWGWLMCAAEREIIDTGVKYL